MFPHFSFWCLGVFCWEKLSFSRYISFIPKVVECVREREAIGWVCVCYFDINNETFTFVGLFQCGHTFLFIILNILYRDCNYVKVKASLEALQLQCIVHMENYTNYVCVSVQFVCSLVHWIKIWSIYEGHCRENTRNKCNEIW